MNDKKMITEISDGQIDDLLNYTLPYTEQNAANIKTLALSKIKSKRSQRPYYRQILIAVAMVLLLSLGVGAYYIGTLFFAPGYGILKDSDFTVYATKEQIKLGNYTVDAVTRTVDGNDSTVCVWLFRQSEVDISESDRIQGIPPDELSNVTLVFNEGTEIKSTLGRMASIGFSQYIYENTPDTNTFKIRDTNGNEAEVNLEDISKTEYANIKGIKFGNVLLTAVPLSGTGNVFAAELNDNFTLNIAKYYKNEKGYVNRGDNSSVGILATFYLESENGGMGYATGGLMLSGDNRVGKYDTVNATWRSYDMNSDKLILQSIFVHHTFWGIDTPEYSFIVPNHGETLNCDFTLFDCEGVSYKIKSIKKEGGELIFETEIKDNIRNKYRTKAQFGFELAKYQDMEYDDGKGGIIKVPNDRITMNFNIADNGDGYYKLSFSNEVNSGEEIYIKAMNMNYSYTPSDDYALDDPSQNLGVVNLK